MAETIDPALAGQQDEQDPDIEALVNMDTETAKQMADSVYRAAPVGSLLTASPKQRDREVKGRTLWGKWKKLLQDKGGITGEIASYIDPLARAALQGTDALAHTFALKGSQEKAKNVVASALGDEEFRHIQGDGITVARQALDVMGPDDNEGMHALVEGVAQFVFVNAVLPEVGAEKALAGAATKVATKFAPKVAKYAPKAAKLAAASGKGAMVDAAGYDPHQERFANMLVNAPLGIGDAAKLLAANPDDSDAEGRFKAALEGIFVGSVFDVAVAALKGTAKVAGRKVVEAFTPEGGKAPALADFNKHDVSNAGEEIKLSPPKDDFMAVPTDEGKFTVEPAHDVGAAIPTADLPQYDTLAEAQTAAAQLSYASRNAKRPSIVMTPEQEQFVRAYGQWVKDTGKFNDVMEGTLDASTGELRAGPKDINFKYDMNPEEWGHIISSMSTVLRSEIEGVKLPESAMHDPKGGAHISHAETLAGTVKAHDGTNAGALTNELDTLREAVERARYSLLAARMLRQNIAAQVDQLTRQLDAPGATHVAHAEFTKAANTLVNLYAKESALAGEVARTLESRKIKAGKFGALVDRKALSRSLGRSVKNTMKVIRFELLDDAAVTPEEVAQIEQAAKKRRKKQFVPPREGDVSGLEVPVGENPPGTKQVGTNTYTLIDEAEHRIDEALDKLDANNISTKPATEKQAAKAVAKDGERMDRAFAANGVTEEDRKLAAERLKAMKQSLAEKRKAGGKIVNLSQFSDEELDDLASMTAERVAKLAEAQRANPMIPKKETTVYLTRRQLRAMARQMTYTPRNEKERGDVLKAILGIADDAAEKDGADVKASTWEKVVAYRATSMLSSPKTGLVNFFSAIGQSLYRPGETYLGALFNKDKEGMAMAQDMFIGTLKSFHDAWGVTKQSFNEGRSILAAKDPSMPSPDVWKDSAKPVRIFMDWLGTTGKFMTSGDEFAQQVSYRGHVYAQSMRNARNAGLSGDELTAALKEDMDRAFNEHGQGVNPSALTYAQDVTLRRPLEYGVGKIIEDGARESKIMRIMFPFVRIPINLVRYQMDRLPGVGAFTRRNRQDFIEGGMQRNEMIGRQVAGVMFWGSSLAMVDAGIVTGGGPSDPDLRRTWLNKYQPYSIKLPGTNTWVSYRRFEPLSTPLGIVADFHQMLGELDEDGSDKTTGKIISAFLAGVGQNLTSKTYLKTLSDFFYAIGSGKTSAVEGFLSGMAGSFFPTVASSLDWDDNLRQTRDIVDQVKARVPGLSLTLEPRRNIYGEKVMKPAGYAQRAFNPFTFRHDDADEVDNELLRLGEQMAMPSTRKFGVDLADRALGKDGKQSPYDRWMELMSTRIDGEPTLREELRQFVTSPEYQDLTEDVNGFQGTKSLGVEAIVRKHRAMAFAKLMEENPKVLERILATAGEKAAALSGDPDMAEALTRNSDDVQRNSLARDATAFIQ